MKWLLAGASGFLGTALRVRLATDGDEVVRLVRREPATATEYRWDPDALEIDTAAFDGVDAVVNLCGVGVANWLWTTPRREQMLRSSRINPSRTLATALAAAPPPVRRRCCPGRGHRLLRHPPQHRPSHRGVAGRLGLPGSAGRDWEHGRGPAAEAGVRVVLMRTSPVLDRSGGSFRLMKAAWSLGGGAVLGGGRQRMPMISLEDYLRFVLWAAENERASGPYNLTIPEPTTNVEFSDVLAAEVRIDRGCSERPPRCSESALGELAEQLLGDMYVVPRRSLEQGFHFAAPDVRATSGRPHLDSAT